MLNLSPGTLRYIFHLTHFDTRCIDYLVLSAHSDAVGVSISLSIIVNYVLILAPAREYIEGMAIRYYLEFFKYYS